MLCRAEEKDPRKCVNEGKAVTACTMDFFQKVKQTCLNEFNQYATCIQKSSGDYSLKLWVVYNTWSLPAYVAWLDCWGFDPYPGQLFK